MCLLGTTGPWHFLHIPDKINSIFETLMVPHCPSTWKYHSGRLENEPAHSVDRPGESIHVGRAQSHKQVRTPLFPWPLGSHLATNHSLIHRCLLSSYHVPGTSPGTGHVEHGCLLLSPSFRYSSGVEIHSRVTYFSRAVIWFSLLLYSNYYCRW